MTPRLAHRSILAAAVAVLLAGVAAASASADAWSITASTGDVSWHSVVGAVGPLYGGPATADMGGDTVSCGGALVTGTRPPGITSVLLGADRGFSDSWTNPASGPPGGFPPPGGAGSALTGRTLTGRFVQGPDGRWQIQGHVDLSFTSLGLPSTFPTCPAEVSMDYVGVCSDPDGIRCVADPLGDPLAGTGSDGSGGVDPSGSTPPPDPVRCVVPRLKGLTLHAARQRLGHAHCRAGTVARRHVAHARKGHVVRQGRTRGTVLRRGARVRLVVAR